MGWRRWLFAALCLGVFSVASISAAEAFYIDPKKKTLEVIGKVQSRVTLRLQDAEGFTQPIDVRVGDLVQWRNLALIEVNHDLKRLTRDLGVLYPFKALDIDVKYHLVGRFMYEGVYDVGPQAFRDVKDNDRENIRTFSQQYDLWEFYFDLSRGPAFCRIGRQNLAWGETDSFRLLDSINPLDNTFGGPFEDLDDRRIPLWMLRGSYNFGRVGPVATFTVEGFWVPGNWDTRVAPIAPTGTPYAAPEPQSPLGKRFVTPGKKMRNSRWGVRVMGLIANNYNFTIAHYKTFLDAPALRLAVGDSLLDTTAEIVYDDVQITGGSLSFWEEHTDVIVRTEVAWFWDEPVFIPEINTPIITPIPVLPTLQIPQEGKIPKKDMLKWVIGLDKNFWIRPLNPVKTFLVTVQYFGTWVQCYDDRMRQPLPIYPDQDRYPVVKEVENLFTGAITTEYLHGDLVPTVAVFYDVRGAWLVSPMVNYIFEPFRFMIQYTAVAGNFTGIGAFRDRDQISFIFSYLLN
jgi:hypothetical protein